MLITILLLIFFQSQNSNFLGTQHFQHPDRSLHLRIMAVGMTFVILTAGIDLPPDPFWRVCAMTAAYVIKGDNFTTVDPNAWGGELADRAGDLSGDGYGDWFFCGLGVTRLRLLPFIVTLGG